MVLLKNWMKWDGSKMKKSRFIYIAKFKSKQGKQYEFGFDNLDQLRIHLVHGWELPYDESKLESLDTSGVIYDRDDITIRQVGVVR